MTDIDEFDEELYQSLSNKTISLLIKIGKFENIARNFLENKKILRTLKYYYDKLIDLSRELENATTQMELALVHKQIEKVKPKLKKLKIFYKLY